MSIKSHDYSRSKFRRRGQNGIRNWRSCKDKQSHGETNVTVKALREGKIPEGYAFIPYGPPSSCLFDGETCATGMPASKGMTIDIEFIKKGEKRKQLYPQGVLRVKLLRR